MKGLSISDSLKVSDLVASVGDNGADPKEFKLYQNYPNPFNPATMIRFQIAKRGHVLMKVYDVLGREVVTLVNDVKEPGTYTVQWNATNFASGVYFYRLDAGSYTSVKKLLLLK
jgi:hypothetical protein